MTHHPIGTLYQFLKSHTLGTAWFSGLTSLASLWLADVDRLASWAAFLVSLGTFIIIAPRVWAQIVTWVHAITAALRGQRGRGGPQS